MKPCSAKTGSGRETNARTSGLKTGSRPGQRRPGLMSRLSGAVCRVHAMTAATRAEGRGNLPARFRSLCVDSSSWLNAIQSSISSNSRGSRRPIPIVKRMRASGSTAHRSAPSTVAETPTCAH